MTKNNLQRMIQLTDEFFQVKHDPSQISVNAQTRKKLERIHPQTLNETRNRYGPIAWVLVIPTTQELMKRFIKKKITEQELLNQTPLKTCLCSALVLPEHRRKGVAKRLLFRAIKSIRKDHPITALFYWSFSVAGMKLAKSAKAEFNLPLYRSA